MRVSVLILAVSALTALGGAALIGTWCVGLVGIAYSAALTWWGLFRDDRGR